MHPLTAIAATLAVVTPLAPLSAAPAQPAPAVAVAAEALTLPTPKAGRRQPLVVLVAQNKGAETSDFIVPYGVLKDSGVASVLSLSTSPGPVRLLRSLQIRADQTVAAFDAAEPAGADIVIVPAQASPRDPLLVAWVRAQAAKGATIVSVCEGARVLANAGLLKGRRAVTHWSAMGELAKAHPDTTWVRDRRYVQDGAIISTTGVTASVPMSLALVEAIAGRGAAQATAQRIGVADWSPAHRTEDFRVGKAEFVGALGTMLAIWNRETVEAPIAEGVDEIGLALRADAWGRSLRTTVVTTHAGGAAVRSRHGLQILPDGEARSGRYVVPGDGGPAIAQLEDTLRQIGHRYGPLAVRLAKLGMEYDAPPPTSP